MPDKPVEPRLMDIETKINEAKEALEECAADLDIQHRIESANSREIMKLKRHVAKLQTDAREHNTAGHAPELDVV